MLEIRCPGLRQSWAGGMVRVALAILMYGMEADAGSQTGLPLLLVTAAVL